MERLSIPYKGATPNHVSQTFHSGHKGLDMVVFAANNGYGTPLTAPEDVKVLRIIGDTYTPGSNRKLEHGYGLFMKGLETGFTHFYWHTLPILPVSVGQVVRRGEIVAFMGNAGNVRSGGVYVPIEQRTKKPYAGTHLHYELMSPEYRLGGVKRPLNPLDYLDWGLEPTYGIFGLVGAVSAVVAKALHLTK